MISKTELGKSIKEPLDKGMNLSEELETRIWKNIFLEIRNENTNVLNLGSSEKLKMPLKLIEEWKYGFKIIAINLELEQAAFERRCLQTLKKGKDLNTNQINSFLQRYLGKETKRKQAIAEVERNTNTKFKKCSATENEMEIIKKQINENL